jgi:HK97 family phage prohead protease
MEYTRSFALEDISVRSEGGGRTVDAYAAVFNTPAPVKDPDGEYLEELDPAAFNRAIDHTIRYRGGVESIPVMFNHGMTIFHTPSELDSMPIGVPEEIRADKRGLFTRTRYLNTPRADAALENIKAGSIRAYSFRGEFKRSNPAVPRGGFRSARNGDLTTVRRMESTLKEYGPCTFPIYDGAEVIAVRAEQAALLLSRLAPGELDRLAAIFASGTRLDQPEADTPDDSGLATEDPPEEGHSARTPQQAIRARYAEFIRTRSAT